MTVGAQVKGCFSSIKSAEASLNTLGNKVTDKEAKDAFEQTENIIAEIKDDMKNQVIRLTREEPQYK